MSIAKRATLARFAYLCVMPAAFGLFWFTGSAAAEQAQSDDALSPVVTYPLSFFDRYL